MLQMNPGLFSGRLGETRWQLLRQAAGMGSADVRTIADRAGLATSTTRSIMDELVQLGLLERNSLKESARGRPGQLFGFSPDAGYVVGVEVGRQAIEVSIVDLTGTLLGTSRKAMVLSNPPDAAVKALAQWVWEGVEQAGGDPRRVVGAGVAIEGLFYGPEDVWLYHPTRESLDRMPLQSMLAHELRLPVLAEDHGRGGCSLKHGSGP